MGPLWWTFALVRVYGLWMILVCLEMRGGELGEWFEGWWGFLSRAVLAPSTGHSVFSPLVHEFQSAPCLLGSW